MNTLSGEERAALRDSVHRLLQDQSSESAVRAVMETDSGYDRSLWQSLAEMGVDGVMVAGCLEGVVTVGSGDRDHHGRISQPAAL